MSACGCLVPWVLRPARALLRADRVSLIRLPGLGHLAHEEQPEVVAALCIEAARAAAVLEPCAAP